MVVAVDSGLGDLSRQLQERGYRVVSYPEYKGVVDAFIYKDEMSRTGRTDETNTMTSSLENYADGPTQGILIISANNKDISQIEHILKTRLYSPLF